MYLKGSGKDDGKKLLSQAEKLWEETLKTGGEWCARSRWNLIVLNAGHYENIPKACSLCEEQFKEFQDSWRGRQAKLTMAWLYMVDRQWKEAQRHFQDLADCYDEHDNPRIADYLARCDEALRKK